MSAIKNFPLADVARSCERIINSGGFILQKWTCSGCGARITASNVNVMTHKGHCQHCNHVTDIDRDGCNFMAIRPSQPMTVHEVELHLGLIESGKH